MDLTLLLMAFSTFWKLSASIRCYKCVPERVYVEEHIPLCEHFDGSDRFVADCPYSTMCFKKETLLVSLGVSTKSVERGCAAQTMDGEQEKKGGQWRHVKNIHEVYREGCEVDSNGGRPTKTTHCYCRGGLCNSGRSLLASCSIIGLGLFLLL